MQQTLQSKFLDILLSLSLSLSLSHATFCITKVSLQQTPLLCSPLTPDITLSLILFTC
jgi:hypothetical protein